MSQKQKQHDVATFLTYQGAPTFFVVKGPLFILSLELELSQ